MHRLAGRQHRPPAHRLPVDPWRLHALYLDLTARLAELREPAAGTLDELEARANVRPLGNVDRLPAMLENDEW